MFILNNLIISNLQLRVCLGTLSLIRLQWWWWENWVSPCLATMKMREKKKEKKKKEGQRAIIYMKFTVGFILLIFVLIFKYWGKRIILNYRWIIILSSNLKFNIIIFQIDLITFYFYEFFYSVFYISGFKLLMFILNSL